MKDLLTVQNFETLIFEFRGKKVMTDTDLAALYETETKKLKQQVRRNLTRFSKDFMFELTKEEKEQLLANTSRLSNLKFMDALADQKNQPLPPVGFKQQKKKK